MRTHAPALAAALLVAAPAAAQPAPEQARLAGYVAELGDERRREDAAWELTALGAPAVPALLAALAAFPPFDATAAEPALPLVQVHALDVLARLGPAAAPAVPQLVALLDDAPWHVRGNVAWTLGALMPFATADDLDAAWNALQPRGADAVWGVASDAGRYVIRRADNAVRQARQRCFHARGARAMPITELMHRLQPRGHPNLVEREVVAAELRQRGADAHRAVPLLRALLAEYYPAAPTPAALALRETTQRADPLYLPVLADALLALSPDDAALVWTHHLVDGSPRARLRAARALGHLGASAHGAVRYLMTAARCDEPRVAAEAITALGMIGPAAHPAQRLLEELSAHEDAQLRVRAEVALRQVRG